MKTTRPLCLALLLVAFASSALADEAPPEQAVLRHPVEEVDVAALLPPEAGEQPHVLFVNVGGALDDAAMADATAYIRSRWMLAVWTNAVESVEIPRLVADRESARAAVSDQAVLIVYVVENDDTANYLSQPGTWALVNLRGLDKGSPEPLLMTKRRRQMLLKGLCFAAGVGVNSDPYCVMYAGSFTPEGMDAVSATLSPFAYGPLLESLRRISGNALFVPFGG